ncbi:MAG: hypothetical protein PF440_05075 [Thiomicrorhabdus sp.]|jgi:hypothetical protein|nr:hypothetical protein [Thiomicrorhabdus sp.]
MIAELKTELQNTAYDLETDQAVADYLNGLVAVDVTEITSLAIRTEKNDLFHLSQPTIGQQTIPRCD